MKQASEWTKEEFEILVRNISLSDEKLANQLPRRTLDAIQIVRNGIHEYHKKGDSTLLSKMMKDRITKSGKFLSCPICGERI